MTGVAPDTLERLVEAAYSHFDLPVPASTGVCRGCCLDPDIEADFLNHGARDLPLDYLEDWYFAAYAADISRAHLGWLLPRILELLAFEPDFGHQGLEVTLNRLPVTGFPADWPAADQALVADTCLAIFARRIADPDSRLDEWLCCMGEAGLDIRPFLAHLDGVPDAALVAILARDWHPGRPIPFSGFWARQPAKDRVWEWYTSPALRDRLVDHGVSDGADTETALALASVIEAHMDWAPS